MKFKMLLVTAISVAAISGCASSSQGLMQGGHNGKPYWNPGNCEQYKYSMKNSDEINCVDSDGEPNGTVLLPLSQQEIENHHRANLSSDSNSGMQGLRDYLNSRRSFSCTTTGTIHGAYTIPSATTNCY